MVNTESDPYHFDSEENTNTLVTAGEDGLKFWDLR